MIDFNDEINHLTRQYNDVIRAMESSYKMENKSHALLSSYKLRRQYSQRYEALEREYRQKCNEIATSYKKSHPQWAKWRNRWGILFCLGIFFLFIGCIGHLGTIADDNPAPATSQAVSQTAETYWNADNIPIPYLQDSTQYVSNPDYVLQQQTVDRMNVTLKRLENELGIQAIFIVVNHIENDDPFRMAQDVGNKYGVGY